MACMDRNIQPFARVLAICGYVSSERSRSLKKSGMRGFLSFKKGTVVSASKINRRKINETDER